jgi:pyridoxal phosphate enzyme (YggS family)
MIIVCGKGMPGLNSNQMAVNAEKYQEILAELKGRAQLVAVSKTKPVEDIQALYDLGQRDFGENYVQELVEKREALPADIHWHFIGHLQSNKVKYIASFVHLVHGVDSLKLLKEIDKQAAKAGRRIDCLLQVHIAREETKFGFDASELETAMQEIAGSHEPRASGESIPFRHVRVRGLMGMASLDQDSAQAAAEFKTLRSLFDKWFAGPPVPGIGPDATAILSMGMSGDYQIAIREGSNMVRVGSLLFGQRS